MSRSLNLRSGLLGVAVIGLALLGARAWSSRSWETIPEPATVSLETSGAPLGVEASHEQVVRVCGACHAYPPPGSLARYDWPKEVIRGYDFLAKSGQDLQAPPPVEVARYYIHRAPPLLPQPSRAPEGSPERFAFRRSAWRGEGPGSPGIANVRFARLFDGRRLDILACDMEGGQVLAWKPYQPSEPPVVLAAGLKDPDHAEVVDLDQDGVRDVLVAALGDRYPSNDRVGSVVWLRGDRDGRFAPTPLAEKLGRVADAQAADFDGDGDLDLVVAAFGSVDVGEVLYLENRTTDYTQPRFVPTTVDPRHGAIHVPVADLDGDGLPDFIALISQEHETVVAFLNRGGGRFDSQTIYTAPHPGYGSSGIQVVDLDGDGDRDVLMTNGDVLDRKVLRPYHGIQWLENRGTYPFVHHALDSVYGVSRAVAGDLDGDGDVDIVATTFLPGGYFQRIRPTLKLDSVLVLEQTEPGRFVRHTIESDAPDHASCDLGDFDADGRLDLVTANCFFTDPDSAPAQGDADGIILYRNQGGAPAAIPDP
jgi:hypothetical protein